MSPAQVPVVDPTGLCPVHYLYIRIDPADVLRGFAVSRFINIALLLSRRFWVSRHPRVPKAHKGADILSFLPPLGGSSFHPIPALFAPPRARESPRVLVYSTVLYRVQSFRDFYPRRALTHAGGLGCGSSPPITMS